MLKYIVKRVLLLIPVLIGVSFIVFTIMSFTPGDPATAILGNGATKEEIQQLNEELGYYDPFFERYFDYVINAVQGDFGDSYRTLNRVNCVYNFTFRHGGSDLREGSDVEHNTPNPPLAYPGSANILFLDGHVQGMRCSAMMRGNDRYKFLRDYVGFETGVYDF